MKLQPRCLHLTGNEHEHFYKMVPSCDSGVWRSRWFHLDRSARRVRSAFGPCADNYIPDLNRRDILDAQLRSEPVGVRPVESPIVAAA